MRQRCALVAAALASGWLGAAEACTPPKPGAFKIDEVTYLATPATNSFRRGEMRMTSPSLAEGVELFVGCDGGSPYQYYSYPAYLQKQGDPGRWRAAYATWSGNPQDAFPFGHDHLNHAGYGIECDNVRYCIVAREDEPNANSDWSYHIAGATDSSDEPELRAPLVCIGGGGEPIASGSEIRLRVGMNPSHVRIADADYAACFGTTESKAIMAEMDVGRTVGVSWHESITPSDPPSGEPAKQAVVSEVGKVEGFRTAIELARFLFPRVGIR